MGGVPCVRHLRIPVATVLRLLAGGRSEAEILSEYPDLETQDIRECLRFAAASAMEREIPLPRSAWDSSSTMRGGGRGHTWTCPPRGKDHRVGAHRFCCDSRGSGGRSSIFRAFSRSESTLSGGLYECTCCLVAAARARSHQRVRSGLPKRSLTCSYASVFGL